jgi:hypothetical protein
MDFSSTRANTASIDRNVEHKERILPAFPQEKPVELLTNYLA